MGEGGEILSSPKAKEIEFKFSTVSSRMDIVRKMKVVTVNDSKPSGCTHCFEVSFCFHSVSKCLLSTYYMSGVSGVAPVPGPSVMNKTVRNGKGSEVLSCLQANKLACPAYRLWQKTRDSWPRDKGLYPLQHSRYNRQPELLIGPPCPTSPREDAEQQRQVLCTQ